MSKDISRLLWPIFTIFAYALAPPDNPLSRHLPLVNAVRSAADQGEEAAGAVGNLQPTETGGGKSVCGDQVAIQFQSLHY